MPELGKYAFAVLGSYVVSIGLLAVLAWLSIARARRIKAQLSDVEKRSRKDG